MPFSKEDVARAADAIEKATFPDDGGEHFELEFRLGMIDARHRTRAFRPEITKVVFDAIVRGLRTNPKWTDVEETHTVDHATRDGVRTTVDVQNQGLPRKYMKKTRIFNEDLKNTDANAVFDVRISGSRERAIEEVPEQHQHQQQQKPVSIREKKRTSFQYKFWRYDATEVTTHYDANRDKDEDRKTTYELELELVDPTQVVGRPRDYVEYIVNYGLLLCGDMMRMISIYTGRP